MNKVLLIGRLTKDCELKQIGEEGNLLINFTIAVQRSYVNNKGEREADFIPVSYWRKSAESLAPNLTKGRLVSILGRINVRSYTNANDEKRYITQVVAEQINFMEHNRADEEAK
ncbi:single-stranded DNA-binding protein [Clostridium sp. MSJ-11]|uniref:Single-stranded DNA-binding protein n=1 Tax=Clostridium mobile TaxID=2841512 RepID=A0ABS6EDD1_9CLOT|nr:single-stranded DNA-binding protein [Clostridium mobile]MBU5483043.1 single-stranded DNA-binding protein [Clostridium mobile]